MDRETLGAIIRQHAFGLSPYDPAVHQPRDMGLGGVSTEYLATEEDQSGQPVNVPQIWWDKAGDPHMLTLGAAMGMAQDYESATGERFPRYPTFGAGAEAAMNRSAMGGAQIGKITKALAGR